MDNGYNHLGIPTIQHRYSFIDSPNKTGHDYLEDGTTGMYKGLNTYT